MRIVEGFGKVRQMADSLIHLYTRFLRFCFAGEQSDALVLFDSDLGRKSVEEMSQDAMRASDRLSICVESATNYAFSNSSALMASLGSD